MPFDAPVLDNRNFQDIVDELKKRIPLYCPEWTDHNVSDPGVTLIELFSYVTEQLLYRMNQVPRLHYIRMMDLLGIQLQGSQPAQVPVTFSFSAPFMREETVPAGTQVSTTQTETKPPIVFATTENFVVQRPQLKAVYTGYVAKDWSPEKETSITPINYDKKDRLASMQRDGQGVSAFSPSPQSGDALYFGFENNLSGYIVRFQMEVDDNATDGIIPQNPPWKWEASTGNENRLWSECTIESTHNTMGGMSRTGTIQIFLPAMGRMTVKEDSLYWVRVRVDHSRNPADTGLYKKPPLLYQIVAVDALGCTIPAIHSEIIENEMIGVSDGTPGQRFYLESTPVLPRQRQERLSVQLSDVEWGIWREVHHFGDSSVTDCHYTLDSITGELRLGPAIQQRDGTIHQFGAVPPPGARLVMRCYRYGGGIEGNVQVNEINTLKTSIPYVSSIRNREKASGGLNPQPLDDAILKIPQYLRSRERAVTAEDFEYIAQEKCSNLFGRVKCLQPMIMEQPGQATGDGPSDRHTYIDLRVIPQAINPRNPQRDELLLPDAELNPKIEQLQRNLDQYRLLTTRIRIRLPNYEWVSVDVRVNRIPGVPNSTVEEFILRRLYRFLNPLVGGSNETGWPFGKSLHKSEVHQFLIQPSVEREELFPDLTIEMIESMIPYTNITMTHQGRSTNEVDLKDDSVIASGKHQVMFR